MTKKTTILVTRPQRQGEILEDVWANPAWEWLFQPTIVIGEPEDGYAALDQAIADCGNVDWMVFSSVNGVEVVVKRWERCGKEISALNEKKIAAIGPGTEKALEKVGISVDFVPSVFRAEGLAEGLLPWAEKGEHFLLIRASRGREILAERLLAGGGKVSQVVAYSSRDVTPDSPAWNPQILVRMEAGEIDFTTVTSSAIARSLVRLFGQALYKTKLISISSLTSDVLRQAGFPPFREAAEATMESLLETIRQERGGNRRTPGKG